jgi:hypothetical protein
MLAAVICLGMTTGCERTVPGTVAMTTQPGPTTTTRPPRTTSRPTAAPTRTSSPTSEVPAPANALTMTCKEFTGLDDATKKAVVKAILDQEKDNPFGTLGTEFAESIASTMCEFLPDSTVREVLMGSPPR